jgi:hypothetical protein
MKTIKPAIFITIFLSASALLGQTGIRAGINMANEIKSFGWNDIFTSLKNNNLTGYQIGIVQQIMSKNNGFGSDISILLSQKGYMFTSSDTGNNCYKEINFLEIPLNLRYRLQFSFFSIFGYGGMYAAYALGGKTVDETDKNATQTIAYPHFDDHLDYGFNIGAGIEFFNKIQLTGVWSQGLKNTAINTDEPAINRILSLYLVYMF